MRSFKSGARLAVGAELAVLLPQDAPPWYRTPHLLRLNLILIIPWLSAAAYGYDGSIMNGLQSLPQWREYFSHPTSSILGTMNAIYPIGKFFGVIATSWTSDRYGHKVSMYIGFFLLVVGAALGVAAQEVALFIVGRLVLGIGTAFVSQPAPVLVSELPYPTHRGRLTAMYYSNYFFLLYFVPESPRWLIAKGKKEQANALLTRYHAGGDPDSSLVAFEMNEIEISIAIERSVNSEMSYSDLVKTKPNRKRTFIAMVVGFYGTWAGVSIVAYYLTLVLNTIGITDGGDQTLINECTQIFNFIVSISAGLLIDRVGRRKLWLVGAAGMLVSFVGWRVLSAKFQQTKDVEIGRSVLAFIFLYKLFYNGAYSPMSLAYPIEIFPYTLRSRGLSTSMATNQVALIIAQFVNPIALEKIGWHYYIVFGILLTILFTIAYFFFPETKEKTLEEIAEVFDGPQATYGGAKDIVLEEHVEELESGASIRRQVEIK